ncbi:MAG: Na+/H+ antiporter NhaA [Rhodothermales bacterium]|nr:Na+/H+ antiporter NhaA [Rhodothermales bacterium]
MRSIDLDLPRRPVPAYIKPFHEFTKLEAAGGLLLLLCSAVALIWANSPAAPGYFALWETYLNVSLGGFVINKPVLLWVNDGLMAIFFFLVGLEIKRELLGGELASPRQAALPMAAALGGMLVPAGIYVLLNVGTPYIAGWGIPMATDIAFALGVLALLGKRAPLSLKIFLSALAIVDDLGAVLVIALFYTAEISFAYLGTGLALLGLSWLANRLGIRRTAVYVALGLGVWVMFLKSGVHATVAGVLLALTIPVNTRVDVSLFLEKGRMMMDLIRGGDTPPNGQASGDQRAAIQGLEVLCEGSESPLQRMERALHGWVAFGIMPIFAFANAGVALGGGGLGPFGDNTILIGVALGLMLGKPIGVFAFTWAAVRTGIAILPTGLTWRHIFGVACIAGIGFTMALFIANLAFTDSAMLNSAKIGIMGASLISGLLGWGILAGLKPIKDAE